MEGSIVGWDRVKTGAFENWFGDYILLTLASKLFIAENSERVSITFVWVTAGGRFIWVKFVKMPEQKFEILFTLHAVSLNQSKSALYGNLNY